MIGKYEEYVPNSNGVGKATFVNRIMICLHQILGNKFIIQIYLLH